MAASRGPKPTLVPCSLPYCLGKAQYVALQAVAVRWPHHDCLCQFGVNPFTQPHAAVVARRSAFTLAAGFFFVPLAIPCETAFSTAPSVTPFFTAFRTEISIFLTALVCFLAIIKSLRSEDDLQLGIVHGHFPFVAA